MTNQKYFIGEYYRYPNSQKEYKLLKVERFVYVFDCGHRISDNVFNDLIRVRTNIQVYLDTQLEMF
jgi:hypothetical protein